MRAILKDMDGVKYIVSFEGEDVFIGSENNDQLLIHRMMDDFLVPKEYVKDLELDGYIVTGVGFARSDPDERILQFIKSFTYKDVT